jgi:2-phospho-L-lactate guanylyltransferase
VAGCAVLVPVKAFGAAKGRLAGVLGVGERAALARSMAERVVGAAGGLPVWVACDDGDVAEWASARRAHVVWTAGLDLDGSVAHGLATLRRAGVASAVVAHADLPLAAGLARVTWFAGGATVVPDRRDDGTNVLHVRLDAGFSPSYGPGSFARHVAQLRSLGLNVRVARIPDLQWDVDVPEDLAT